MALLRDPLPGLGAFVRAVELGSFSQAARALGTSPSAVSKAVAKLEARVGVLLLQRSTRTLKPTTEGLALYERGVRIVAEMDAAHSELCQAKGPRGLLRVTAPVDFGQHWLIPRLPAFLAKYPEVRCEVGLTDRFVDMIDERFDVGLRMGEAADARLIRRKLGTSRAVVCAAPSYLRKRGAPRRIADLLRHDCLTYVRDGKPEPWRMGDESIPVSGTFTADNNGALLAMAVAGRGIARLPEFVAASAVEAGTLRVILPSIPTPLPTTYVIYPERRHLSARVRAFVDFVSA